MITFDLRKICERRQICDYESAQDHKKWLTNQ